MLIEFTPESTIYIALLGLVFIIQGIAMLIFGAN